MGPLVITAAAAYLLGSIPFGYLLLRIFRGQDVRLSGSGNIGATNVSRTSPVLGILTLLLDAAKGSAAALLAGFFARSLTPTIVFQAVSFAALCAVLGHMFPIWLKFRGGKGVATGLGAFLIIAPKAVLVATILFVAVVAISRFVSLGSVIAVAAFPIAVVILQENRRSPISMMFISLVSLLIIIKHHTNIRRLRAGTENRLGSRPGRPELKDGERR
jgi:acyl phosphate:glycerol-3-phosphate acyltransferase